AVGDPLKHGSRDLVSGQIPARLGDHHANIDPYETLTTSYGEVVIAVGNDTQYENLCQVMGISEIAKDALFKTNPDRVANRTKLVTILQKVFLNHTSAYWKQQCDDNNIPCGPIQNLEEVYHDPHLQERDMFVNMNHPTAG